MAGKMGEVLKSMGGVLEGPKPGAVKGPSWEDMGGEKWLVDAQGNVLRKEKKSPSPRDPNAPSGAEQVRDQRMFIREQQLADDYNKDTKETRDMAVKVMGALSEAPAAKRGDGIAQVNLLYAFVSSMDPGTAVREGEIGLVRSAGSLVQQAQAMLSKYGQGQAVTVPPAMVEQIAQLMKRRLEGSQRYVKSRASYYKGRARQWGVNESAFPELDIPTPESAPVKAVNPLLK
jgi:hypothetical protein